MNAFRLIAKLDIKNEKLVKGIKLEGLRNLGNPYNFINYYYKNGIDEIILHDVTASLYGNNCITGVISEISKNIFIPILAGGGIRTLKDIERILMSGCDRVLLNSAVIKDIKFLKKAANTFGSSNISINIEYLNIKNENKVFYEYGRQETKFVLIDWIKKVQDNGAGEIMLTSIDREGTGNGFDLDVLSEINKICKVPLTIHGGCSNFKDIKNLVLNNKKSKVTGVALSSLLHYNFLRKEKKINFSISNKWEKTDIKIIKKKLKKENIFVR
jgi:cyclase